MVDENQRILREDEAKRQAALAEAQATDVKVNQDKKDNAKKVAHEGTLHRPASKVGVKSEKEKTNQKVHS